jgi:sugar lactone lactonase YvrE
MTWTAPTSQGVSNITSHEVSYTPNNGTETIVDTASTLSSYNLSGLTDNEFYTVKVRAKNAIGFGPWSASVLQQAVISGSGSWDIGSGTFSQSFNPSIAGPTSLALSSDGSLLYVQDYSTIYQFAMSTAYDLTTASSSTSYTLSNGNENDGFCFGGSGLKLLSLFPNTGNGIRVFVYNLGTAWDVSTASSAGLNAYLPSSSSVYDNKGIAVKPDGTELYVVSSDGSNSTVHQWTMGTAFNTASGVTAAGSFSVASQDNTAEDVAFKDDGTKMYVIGGQSDSIHQYDLSTAWDVTSATYSKSLNISAKDTLPLGLAFAADGASLFICGDSSDEVHKYTV